MPDLIPVAAWIRVSTEMQARDDRAGIPRQREAVERACKAHGLTVIKSFVLEGVSGSITGRTGEWAEVRRLLDSGKIKGVVVDAVDRLCRASDLDLGVLTDLQRAGATIYTPSEVRALSSSSDGLIAGILALVAGQERREIARRMHAGREVNRRQGRWTGDVARLPPGIHYDRDSQEWSTTPEIETVIEMFHRIGRGESSIHALSVESGIPNKTLRDRLRNPLYRGWLVHGEHITTDPLTGRRKRIKRAPEDVIKVVVFDEPPVPDHLTAAVDRVMASNRRAYAVRKAIAGDDVHHLRGMLICADCGSPMSTVRRHRQYGYRCSSAIRQHRKDEPGRQVKPCAGREMPIDDVHLSVVEVVVDRIADDGWLGKAILKAVADGEAADKADRLPKAKARLRGLIERRERLVDLYLGGLLAKDEVERRKPLLDRQIEAVEREVEGLAADGDGLIGVVITSMGRVIEAIEPYVIEMKKSDDAREWIDPVTALLKHLGGKVSMSRPKGRNAPVVVEALHLDPIRLVEVCHEIGGTTR